jgi:gamma-glutamyl:cysteine ligase YbdK (ATP-grasp superfamily)
MGLEITADSFSAEERARFAERLEQSLTALERVLRRPGFGVGPPTIGAEIELSLIDDRGRPLPANDAVLEAAGDPRVTLEIDRWNLEINTRPSPLAGRPFTALREEIDSALRTLAAAAAPLGARVVTTGILPTLEPSDLGSNALSDRHRYRALSAALKGLRREPFQIHIEGAGAGADALAITSDDIALEGANTSFQAHLRVAPSDFAATYNAAQLAAGPLLAIAGNSPLLFGRRLWEETRVALFRQSVDDRWEARLDDWRPARVSFGHGWVREGALELFAETVRLHAPLLPVLGPVDPTAASLGDGVPELAELRLHNGTVWHWNRAVYDASAGGHLRIEIRPLPSGPTTADMVANAAFALGLTLGLARRVEPLLCGMTFGQARRNFYMAARHGLDAELLWPSTGTPSPEPVAAPALIARLLPVAREALIDAGVEPDEVARELSVIEGRLARGLTGARWQVRALETLERGSTRHEAIAAMLERYQAEASRGAPVHTWPLPS